MPQTPGNVELDRMVIGEEEIDARPLFVWQLCDRTIMSQT
jgi:hypothetical protein